MREAYRQRLNRFRNEALQCRTDAGCWAVHDAYLRDLKRAAPVRKNVYTIYDAARQGAQSREAFA